MSEQEQRSVERDPLVAALARYIEALHLRYPNGPDQMRRDALARADHPAKIIPLEPKRRTGAA